MTVATSYSLAPASLYPANSNPPFVFPHVSGQASSLHPFRLHVCDQPTLCEAPILDSDGRLQKVLADRLTI